MELKSTTKAGHMKPSACSKAIAVYMRSLQCIPTGAARRHRWNLDVKINFSGLTSNRTYLKEIDLQQMFDGGIINSENPLEPGKFLIVIKNHVSLCFFVFKNDTQ